jgi:signal transduction histidine kinase
MNIYYLIIGAMLFSLLLTFAVVLFYLRYKKNLAGEQLKSSRAETQHQRALLQAVIYSQEEERKRIGMNLHDEVGSSLSSLRLMLEAYDKKTGYTLLQCKTLIDTIMHELRDISHDLSPLQSGIDHLTDALEDRCESIQKGAGIRVNFDCGINPNNLVLTEQETLALYRVISELFNNTLKHAQAKQIHLHIFAREKEMVITYEDDGKGMPPEPTGGYGMGMRNIESRLNLIGASYQLILPHQGFLMEIRLPLLKYI